MTNRNSEKVVSESVAETRLPAFPVPFPDETLFSVVARFHVLFGGSSAGSTLQRVFGRRTVVTSSGFPGYLCAVERVLPISLGLDAASLIERHTLLPYYRAFLKEDRIALAEKSMRAGNASAINGILGLLAANVGETLGVRRYCVQCIQADAAEYGQPYWHRSHQLPFVIVCDRHRESLHFAGVVPRSPLRHGLNLPGTAARWHKPSVKRLEEADIAVAMHIAKESRLLLERGERHPRRALAEAYRRRVVALSGRSRGMRLASLVAVEAIGRRYSSLGKAGSFHFLSSFEQIWSWTSELTSERRLTSHPWKHIVAADILFGGITELFENARQITMEKSRDSESDRGSEQSISKPIDTSTAAGMQRRSEQRHHLATLLASGTSLRQAAHKIGVSTTTARIHAEQLGVCVTRRRKIPADVEGRVVTALASGVTRAQISSEYGVSLAYVDRVLATNMYLQQQRRDLLKENRRHEARTALLRYLEDYPDDGISDARNAPIACVPWLYRNDREWLAAQFATRSPRRREGRQKINWTTRDAQYVRALRGLERRLSTTAGRPVRYTQAFLLRAAGIPLSAAKSVPRMPGTAAILERLVDTDISYKKRKIEWAVRRLQGGGGPVQAWRIAKLARLRQHEPLVVQKLIEDAMYGTDLPMGDSSR